jgi:hypothetical protein
VIPGRSNYDTVWIGSGVAFFMPISDYEPTSTHGLQHLPALRLRAVLERKALKQSHLSAVGQARATLIVEGHGA